MKTTINIELETSVASVLAMSKGWRPKVDDTSQLLDGDEYQQKDNPVPIEHFLKDVVEIFIKEYVLTEIRKGVRVNIENLSSRILAGLDSGNFDDDLLQGEKANLLNYITAEVSHFQE